MRAIILAAGRGSRLGDLTSDRPKCLVEYKGRPLIDYTIETLRSCNIQEIAVIKGHCADALTREGIRFCTNSEFSTTNMVYSLFVAGSELLEGDVVISYGDIIYRSDVLEKLLACKEDCCVVVDQRWEDLWNQRMDDPMDDVESLLLDSNGYIRELGKKPRSRQDIQGQYIGLIKISSSALARLQAFYHGLDRSKLYDNQPFTQMYMTSFLQAVIDHCLPIKAVVIDGGWLEIDTPRDLLCEIV
jgi:choline kinase